MTFVLSFVNTIILCMEGKEACVEDGTCMEENGSVVIDGRIAE